MSLGSKSLLKYWIEERYRVLTKKVNGYDKPWSDDPIFQTVYFCNVHREHDKVTQWIREHFTVERYGPVHITRALCIARLVNWPPTLMYMIKDLEEFNPKTLREIVEDLPGKVWGGAYIVSTCGQSITKAELLEQRATQLRNYTPMFSGELWQAHDSIKTIPGFSSFMAAQVVADLKNTNGHKLREAPDWWTWAAPGPGSLRGMQWFFGEKITPKHFTPRLAEIRKFVDYHVNDFVKPFCNQDLQNCLCEFDKYMRVRNKVGRSKRRYDGLQRTP